ncbi:MAG: dihydropteroate synthase [Gammaproteobacteria bacterium]
MFDSIRKPLLMGILNVTPDSFSDGGKFDSVITALQQAQKMVAEGADMIDIGGESTRPGAAPVPAAEQLRRVLPVVAELRRALPERIILSIDTASAQVAEAALDNGAQIINDISAGRHDPAMLALAAKRDAPIILMHMQGSPATMQDKPFYTAVVDEVLGFLQQRIDAALAAGVKKRHIAIDPGIGFGKRKQDNIDLLANLQRFAASGYAVLLGTSRKRFMGSICTVADPAELATATAVTTALGVMAGVQMFRVHDIKENRQALDIAWAILERQKGQN